MANVKISQLPAASTVTADVDVLPIVHSGVTEKVTPNQIVNKVLEAPGAIGGTTPGDATFTTLTAESSVFLNPANADVELSPTGSGRTLIQPEAGAIINPGVLSYMDNVAIGGTTPQAAVFTTLTSNSTTTLNGTTIPASKTLVDTDSVQTLSSKYYLNPRIWDWDQNNYYRISPVSPGLATDVYCYLPILTGNDYFSFRNFTETLTNKTISGLSNTLTDIPNSSFQYSSITLGSTSISLGGTASSITGLALTGGTVNNTAIGGTTPAAGAFTTLSASSTVSGTGFSTYLASPPAIGGTTPAAGNFTTLGATGNVTLGDASGDTLTINGTAVSAPNGLNVNSNQLVLSGGNLGLGVTPAAWSATYYAIQGGNQYSLSTSGTSSDTFELASNSYRYTSGFNWKYLANGYSTIYRQNTGQHQWFTAPSGTAGSAISFNQVMTLDASGRLGVGTTLPQQSIHTDGRIRVSTNNVNGGDIAVDGGGLAFSTLTTDAPIIFERNGFAVESARITSGGAFILGDTALVASGFAGVKFDGASYNGIGLNDSSATSGAGYIYFQSNGTTIGNITRDGATSAVKYNTSSDYRLKENVQPIQNALSRVALLKPSTYIWKSDQSEGEGFIAHELQKVVPQAVTGEKDGEQMQGVDYGKLTPLLAAAIQEIAARLETLEAKVN